MLIIDFDEIGTWAAWIGAAIAEIAPAGLLERLKRENFEFIEDARAAVVDATGPKELVRHLYIRLQPYFVRVYHGTRVTVAELAQIRAEGLKSLQVRDRGPALEPILRRHPRWTEVQGNFEDALIRFGPGEHAGRREDGWIHVCFSRSGMLTSCGHYMKYGAEVDGHITHFLFGDDSAQSLLQQARRAQLLSFTVSFSEALAGANPHGFNEEDLPSLLELLISAWRIGRPIPLLTSEACVTGRLRGSAPRLQLTAWKASSRSATMSFRDHDSHQNALSIFGGDAAPASRFCVHRIVAGGSLAPRQAIP